MEFRYNGEYSVNIEPVYGIGTPTGGYNTWSHLNLIPISKPVILPLAFNVNIVQPQGSNRIIDITNQNIGNYKYGQTSGEWEFIVDSSRYSSNYTIGKIEYYIHGCYSKVRIDGDTNIYIGRVYISSIDQEDEYTKITLSYILKLCDDIKYDENYGEISTNSDGTGEGSEQIPSSDTENMILLNDPRTYSSDWLLIKSGHGLPTYKREEYVAIDGKTYCRYIIPDSAIKIKSIVSNSSYKYMVIKYSFKKADPYRLYSKLELSPNVTMTSFTLGNKKKDPNKYGGGYYFYINGQYSTNKYRELAIGIITEGDTPPDVNHEISYFIYVDRTTTGVVE